MDFGNMMTVSVRIPVEEYEEIKLRTGQGEYRSVQAFGEAAFRFYLGYLATDRSSDFINQQLMSDFRAMIMGAEERINRNLFRLAVEENMGHQIIANQWDLGDRRWQELHSKAIREVRATNGKISLEKTNEHFNENADATWLD